MRNALVPGDEAIARLARAECDPRSLARFRPICMGFAGNLLAILVVGTLGLLSALVLAPARMLRK
ncbi:MAG TPA: hypothetical protein VM598_06080 [Bdellovibrionota bacterium]|nr:hypothetical protein [Bdellovibrionota bacterium]